MFYALTGMEAPNRWHTLQPGFLSPRQQRDYVADLKDAEPRYLLLTGGNWRDFGASYFGIDYDPIIYRWIESNYHVVGQFGRFERSGGNHVLAALLYERNRL